MLSSEDELKCVIMKHSSFVWNHVNMITNQKVQSVSACTCCTGCQEMILLPDALIPLLTEHDLFDYFSPFVGLFTVYVSFYDALWGSLFREKSE